MRCWSFVIDLRVFFSYSPSSSLSLKQDSFQQKIRHQVCPPIQLIIQTTFLQCVSKTLVIHCYDAMLVNRSRVRSNERACDRRLSRIACVVKIGKQMLTSERKEQPFRTQNNTFSTNWLTSACATSPSLIDGGVVASSYSGTGLNKCETISSSREYGFVPRSPFLSNYIIIHSTGCICSYSDYIWLYLAR